MYTKSLIQQIVEKNNIKENFKEGLTSFMNKYIVEDAVMSFIGNELMEVTKGYFISNGEYNDINEALKNFDPTTQVMRIMENKIFQIGQTYKFLSDCPKDSKIFNIDKLEYTR